MGQPVTIPIHYNVDSLHLYPNVLMKKTNRVSSFFHDQIGHVYLKSTISDHMVNNRLCNLTPPGSFEHTFVFLFCFLMFEELRHFIIVSTLYPHCFHSTKGQMNNKNQTQERTFSDIRWSTGDTDMKKLFLGGGAQQQQLATAVTIETALYASPSSVSSQTAACLL